MLRNFCQMCHRNSPKPTTMVWSISRMNAVRWELYPTTGLDLALGRIALRINTHKIRALLM